MKKLILTLLAGSLAAGSAVAHCGNCGGGAGSKGGILLYGVGSYSSMRGSETSRFASANSNTVDRPRMLNWEVSPGIGFNVADGLTLGIDLDYMGSKTSYDRKSLGFSPYAIDQVKTWNYGVGPFVRHSMNIGEHFFAYTQLTAHYLRGRETNRYTNSTGSMQFTADDDYKGVNASLVPAVGVMVTKSLGITFGIGGISYEYRKYDYSPVNVLQPNVVAGSEFTAKTSAFDITLGQQLNIGVQKFFGGHKTRGHHEPMDETRSMDAEEGDSNESGEGRKKRRRNDDE